MSFLYKFRLYRIFCRITPSRVTVKWTKEDSKVLGAFQKSPCGQKLDAYLANYVLLQQNASISVPNDLKFNAGACNGSKAILAQITALGEPDNFTDDEGSD